MKSPLMKSQFILNNERIVIIFCENLYYKVILEDEEDMINGMIILKKELSINYEQGAGIAKLEIHHKDGVVFAL